MNGDLDLEWGNAIGLRMSLRNASVDFSVHFLSPLVTVSNALSFGWSTKTISDAVRRVRRLKRS